MTGIVSLECHERVDQLGYTVCCCRFEYNHKYDSHILLQLVVISYNETIAA
jgi:hypothetical protein